MDTEIMLDRVDLLRQIGRTASSNGQTVTVPQTLFFRIVSLLSEPVFRESDYLALYSDIREAASQNKIASPKAHFDHVGLFEKRLPRRLRIDENQYLLVHSDVRKALRSKKITSAQQHFDTVGFAEGRSYVLGSERSRNSGDD